MMEKPHAPLFQIISANSEKFNFRINLPDRFYEMRPVKVS